MKELKCHSITRQETRYINTSVSCQPWGLPARFRTWNVAFLITPHSMERAYHRFRETCCPHLQDKDWGSMLRHNMSYSPEDYNQNLHHQEDSKCHVKYRVFYFAAWPTGAGPTVRLTLCQCCVVRHVSGKFNYQRRVLDKRSFIIRTSKKIKAIYLFHFDVFSTVHYSIELFLQPTLMHNSLFINNMFVTLLSSTCFEH